MTTTGYELAIETPKGKFLVAYCDRKTRRIILEACQDRAEALVSLCGDKPFTFANRAADGALLGTNRIYWTGRTKATAHTEGELPYVEERT